jgi:hypothetical protein
MDKIGEILSDNEMAATFERVNGIRTASDARTPLVLGTTRCTLSVLRFKQGRWRSIAVDIEPRPALKSERS